MLHHIRWPRAQQPTAGAAALGLQRAQVMPEFFQVPFQEVGDTNATWLENCDWKYQNIVILGYYYSSYYVFLFFKKKYIFLCLFVSLLLLLLLLLLLSLYIIIIIVIIIIINYY